MRNFFTKYFVVILSLLLVLSNFSFATSLMICGMSDEITKCECKHDTQPPLKGIGYSKEKSSCCDNETTELSNSNTLSIVKTDLPKDITLFVLIAFDFHNDLSLQYNRPVHSSADKEHVPKQNLPVLISSLLI